MPTLTNAEENKQFDQSLQNDNSDCSEGLQKNSNIFGGSDISKDDISLEAHAQNTAIPIDVLEEDLNTRRKSVVKDQEKPEQKHVVSDENTVTPVVNLRDLKTDNKIKGNGNLKNDYKSNNEENATDDIDNENTCCRRKLEDEPFLEEGTRRDKKPSKWKTIKKIAPWVVSILVSVILFCINRLLPIKQTTIHGAQTQFVELAVNWEHTQHLLPNIYWSFTKADNFIQLNNPGFRIEIVESALYEFYIHLTLDSAVVDFDKRKSKTVGTTVCLITSKNTEHCDKHALLSDTADSVALKAFHHLYPGDFVWVKYTGVNVLYPTTAGNFMTITKYPNS